MQWLKYSARHTTVFAVTTRVQSPRYCRSHQKYCSVMREQVQRKIVSNCLFPFGFTGQPLHLAFAKRSQKALHCARAQGQNISGSSFKECHSSLPFNVDILSRNGRVSEVGHLPDDITIKANGSLTTYKLFGVTHGNGNHFKSAMCLPSPLVPQAGWYEYDGLWEHRQRGSGLHYCGIAQKPATPFAYCLSYALYLRQ